MADSERHDPEPRDSSADEAIDRCLDEAMTKLNDKDRSAVAMRFLQGKTIREVGMTMGISEEAAQKRVGRAIEKLREFFTRRGITIDSATALAQGLSRQLSHSAPATLAPAVTAAALSSATTASSGAGLAGVFAKLLGVGSTKLAASACVAAVVVVAGAGAVVVQTRKPAQPQALNAAPTTAPASARVFRSDFPLWDPYVPSDPKPISTVEFNNAAQILFAGEPAHYEQGVDPNVKRTSESLPASVMRSISPDVTPRAVCVRGGLAIVSAYRGKRVRATAYLKTDKAENGGGLAIVVMGPGNRVIANDDMGGSRAILGTTDWKQYEVVADVPDDASHLSIGGTLRGKGTLWMDKLTLEVVDKSVPITDDRRWHMWSFTPNNYKAEVDDKELRNGKPTICLSSIGPTKQNDWAVFDHNMRDRSDWNGKRLKMSGWMKCENVTHPSGPALRALGPGFTSLKRDNTFPGRPLRGSLGWMKYTVFLDVPENAMGVCAGITLNGGGKIWFDDIQFEIVEKQ